MKSIFHKIAYSVVLMAMILLMGERSVPHHHCGESAACGTLLAGAIHFGYGECEECEHNHCEHSHDSADGQCCVESPLYTRLSSNDTQPEKKFIAFNSDCFLLPEQISLPEEHIFYGCSYYYRPKAPDVGLSNVALRAPPVA